jgi:chromate transporter
MRETANGPRPARRPLGALALLFTRLGFTAFGGPAAHVSMMENEVVHRRGRMSPERFLDLFGAASLLPGPSSSELAIYIGYEQAGLLGLLIAGTCFIVPAALITAGLAWAYVRFGSLPEIGGVLYGVKPIIIAIIAQAVWSLAPKAVKSLPLAAVGVMAVAGAALSVDPILVLVAAGIAGALATGRIGKASGTSGAAIALLGPVGGGAVLTPVTLLGVFLFFLKIGAVVFGSGYVLLAFLHADLVDRLHWLTESQLLDAVAVGQVTPGPVFTTATFIGYVLAGPAGAAIATAAIFLPAFVLVAASRPLVVRVRKSKAAGAFLDGVNVASLGLIVAVTVQLGRAALIDVPTVLLAIVSALVIFRYKLNSAWLVGGGAIAGLVMHGLR